MEFKKTLVQRRTTRNFTDEPITEEQLQEILMAAQAAPIAGADYTMTHITVVQDPAVVEEIREVCMGKRKNGEMVDMFYGAKTMIFLSGHGVSSDYIEYSNVGCAIENMLLMATDMGLGSAYIWGCLRKLRKQPELIAKLNLPEGYEILSAVAVGHRAEPWDEREVPGTIAINRI